MEQFWIQRSKNIPSQLDHLVRRILSADFLEDFSTEVGNSQCCGLDGRPCVWKNEYQFCQTTYRRDHTVMGIRLHTTTM